MEMYRNICCADCNHRYSHADEWACLVVHMPAKISIAPCMPERSSAAAGKSKSHVMSICMIR